MAAAQSGYVVGERMKGWVVKQLYSLLESEIAIAIAVWV